MSNPLKPLVRGGGYYPSDKGIPLVYPGGFTNNCSGSNKNTAFQNFPDGNECPANRKTIPSGWENT